MALFKKPRVLTSCKTRILFQISKLKTRSNTSQHVGNHLLRNALRGTCNHTKMRLADANRIPQIGFHHGSQAKTLVHGSVEFYTRYFQKNSKMSWEAAEAAAKKFHPFLEQHVPHLVEEMRGLVTSARLSTKLHKSSLTVMRKRHCGRCGHPFCGCSGTQCAN